MHKKFWSENLLKDLNINGRIVLRFLGMDWIQMAQVGVWL
jgi:hypothetical protein